MRSGRAGIPPSRSETLDLYKQALELLPDLLHMEVLQARNKEGVPLLTRLAASGDFEMVNRYVKFAMRYPAEKRLLMLDETAVAAARQGGHHAVADLLSSRIRTARDLVHGTMGMPPVPALAESEAAPPRGRRRGWAEFRGDSSEPIDITGSDDSGREVRRRLSGRDVSRRGGQCR
jgi:hypothetical protein